MSKTFTVKQLIEELKQFDESLLVYTNDFSPIDIVSTSLMYEEDEIPKQVLTLCEIPF